MQQNDGLLVYNNAHVNYLLFNFLNQMIKKITFGLSLLILLPASTFAADIDFEINSVEHTSCYVSEEDLTESYRIHSSQTQVQIDGEPKISLVSGEDYIDDLITSDSNIVSDENGTYTLLEAAPNQSWIRVLREREGVPPAILTTACFKTLVEGKGELAEVSDMYDNVPQSMDQFYDLLTNRLAFNYHSFASDIPKYTQRQVLDNVSYMASGRGKWLIPEKVLENSPEAQYGSITITENRFEPGQEIDLYMAVNNTFNTKTRMYDRTWFNDSVRHYNHGPTIPEDNTENNLFIFRDFITLGNDFPASPTINDFNFENGVVSIDWDAVPGAEKYVVEKVTDDLNVLEWDYDRQINEVDETKFAANLITSETKLICYNVRAMNAQGIEGPNSKQFCLGSHFKDVDPSSWYGLFASEAVGKGLLSGYTDSEGEITGRFGGADPITNAEALKIVGEMTQRYVTAKDFGFELPYSIPEKFKDHWAYDYIWGSHIVGLDLLEDIDNFDPDAPITRGELVHLIIESLEVDVPNYGNLSFVDTQGHTYANDIEHLKQLGLISGYDNTNNFGPNDPLNRAAAAKIFTNVTDTFQMSWPE